MTIALSLLISAMQLLTMVQANPNLPPAFVSEVEIIAIQAITTAKEEIAKAQATTTAPAPVQPQIIYVTVPTTTQEPVGSPALVPPTQLKVLSFTYRPDSGFRIYSNVPLDLSKTSVIVGISSPDIKTGSCTSLPDGSNRSCMDWSRTETLPVTFTHEEVSHEFSRTCHGGTGQYCTFDGTLYDYKFTPSTPLIGDFRITFVGANGTTVTRQYESVREGVQFGD